jgi:mono/diheme cytochrome c family protein
MAALIAIIAAFVLVGLVVVAAAFTGGRRRRRDAAPSRGADRALYAGVAIVIVALGLGIPALLLVGNVDNSDRDVAGGVDLTATQVKGRELFAENCATCHALAASNAVGATGPSLDVLKPNEGLVENAILVGRAQGNGNMPAGLLTGGEAKDVANYVAAVAGRDDVGADAPAPPAAEGG